MSVGALGAAPAATQQRGEVVIPDTLVCADCAITYEKLLTLGDSAGPGALIGPPISVVRDTRGRWWVVTPGTPPQVFDASGRFVAQVGRRGRGPGEWFAPFAAGAVGDSVVVWDNAGYFSVIGPDFQHVRSINAFGIEGWEFASFDWPRLVALNGLHSDGDYAGWPVHFLDLTGRAARVVRSVGSNQGVLIPTSLREMTQGLLPGRVLLERRLALTGADRLLSVPRRSYGGTVWSADGQSVGSWVRAPEWFPKKADPRDWHTGSRQRPPDPVVRAVVEDPLGRTWTYSHVPDSAWAETWARVRNTAAAPTVVGQRGVVSVGAREWPVGKDLYHTMVEVLDLAEAGVLARRLLPMYVVAVPTHDRLVAYRETESSGVPVLDVFRVLLDGR